MTRTPVRALFALLAAAGLSVALSSATATGRSTAPESPVVTSVAPLDLAVGDRLTVKGRGFISGRRSNTVVFKRDGARPIFVKADRATRTQLVVVVPDKLAKALVRKDGAPQGTRFRIRVLSRRLARRFTPLQASPRIRPAVVAAPPAAAAPAVAAAPAPVVAPPDCDGDRDPDATDLDDDDDLLPDSQEAAYGTDPCRPDTDGDGLRDHWEIESALDLNGRANFPAVRTPWPNPRFAGDARKDFDQDGMLAAEEHDLWRRSDGPVELTYSDGDQSTTTSADPIGRDHDAFNNLAAPETDHLDHDDDGVLTDDERDFDGDRLGNWDESHGRLRGDWWGRKYSQEAPFFGQADVTLVDAEAVAALPDRAPMYADPDVDGDQVPDGRDDQDHDGWSNEEELHRSEMEPAGHTGPLLDLNGDGAADELRVNPFNPCLPDRASRACTLHPPFTNAWAPFGDQPLPFFEVPAAGAPDRSRAQQLVPWRMAPTP